MSSRSDNRLRKYLNTLEQSLESTFLIPNQRKKLITYEKEKQAVSDIKEYFVQTNFKYIGKEDFNRTIELLFAYLDHRESSLRILADQCLDAIFRQLQIRMHYSRVIASLLAILTKNLSARGVVSALNKLATTIQFAQAKRASLYAFHYLNALCIAMKRPEEAIQTSIEKTSPSIFEFLGPFLADVNIEKAEELYNIAILNFALGGAANRAACIVVSQLAIYAPPILHKSFYKISSIISELDDVEHRNSLVASLITFRLMWKTITANSNDFSLRAIQRLLCKILCCLYSSTNEVLVSSLETLEYVFLNPSKAFNFSPLMVENTSNSATNSPEKQPYLHNKTLGEIVSIENLSDDELDSFATSPWGSIDEMPANISKASSSVISDDDQRTLNDFEVDSEIGQKDYSIADPLLNPELYDEELQRTRSELSLLPSDHTRIPDNLPNDICDLETNLCSYAALLVVSRFLVDSMGGVKDDQKIRISHKILAFNCLSALALRTPTIISLPISKASQITITSVYNFISHDDDGLSVAAFNFFMNIEQSAIESGKANNSSTKTLSMITKMFDIRNPIRLKSTLQILTKTTNVLMLDENVMMKTLDYCLSTYQIDYFLLKIARAEFIAQIPWSQIDAHVREKYQQKCLDSLLLQLFDSDGRVVRATSMAISCMIKNAEFGRLSKIFHHDLPDNYMGSSFKKIPIILSLLPEFSFTNNSMDFVTAQNITHVLECIFRLLTENFYDRQSGIIACLIRICEDFSPTVYRSCWVMEGKTPSTIHNSILLFIEMLDCNCTSLTDLSALLKLISTLSACAFEEIVTRSAHDEERLKLEDLFKAAAHNLMEKLIISYLRIINLYYTILAEEKSKNFVASTSSVLSRPSLMPPSSPRVGERSRTETISNLIGTGVHTTRATSYLNSPVLCQLEPNLRGSFQNYMGSLDTELQSRFSDVLEVALRGLCVLLEMISFDVCKTFLDETLLYCNNLFSIALHSCTQLIHQLLKTIFYKNLININVTTIQSTILRNQIVPREMFEIYLTHSINEFTFFSAFVNRLEYMQLHNLNHMGLFQPNILSKKRSPSIDEISLMLPKFEKFISYLVSNVFPTTNSWQIRAVILDLMCELALNGVKYQLADPQAILWKSVLELLKQLSFEALPILRNIFFFILVMARVSYIEFTDAEKILIETCSKINEINVHQMLSAIHLMVLEAVWIRKEKGASMRKFLIRESEFLFSNAPEKTLQLWTLLIHSSRIVDEESWSETSLDFLGVFTEFYNKKLNDESPNSIETDFSAIIALANCSPSTFRPVDQLFKCLQNILDNNEELSSSTKLSRALPIMFILLNQLKEDVVLLRLNTFITNPEKYLSINLATLLIEVTKELVYSHDSLLFHENSSMIEELLVLQIQIILHAYRAGNFSKILQMVRSTLSEFEDTDLIIQLAQLHPKPHAYWISLLFGMDLISEKNYAICYAENYSNHTKNVITILLTHKVFDEKADKNNIFNVWLKAPPEYFARLLKLESTKNIGLFLKHLSAPVLKEIVRKQQEFLANSRVLHAMLKNIDGLMGTDDAKECEIKANQETQIEGNHEETKKYEDDFSEFKTWLGELSTNPDTLKAICHFVCILPKKEISKFLHDLPKHLIQPCIGSLIEISADIIKRFYCESNMVTELLEENLGKQILDKLFEIIVDDTNLHASDMIFALARFSELFVDYYKINESILLGHVERIFNKCFVETLIACSLNLDTLSCEYYKALSFFLLQPNVVDLFKDPYECIEMIHQFFSMLLKLLEKFYGIPRWQRYKIDKKHWNVSVNQENYKISISKDDVLEMFNLVQRASYLASHKELFASDCATDILKAIKSICRLPVLSSMFIVPDEALKLDWVLTIDLRSKEVVVPMVNIHMLTNPTVLQDFVWRILWLGWSSRTQFENFWTSLFGVLSSTPSGGELYQTNINVPQQIHASCIAVEVLTNILVQTVLYPHPGNTILSRFVVKHREKDENELFLQSLEGKKASVSKSWLQTSWDTSAVYKRNLERLNYYGNTYALGQNSVLYLWSATGVLECSADSLPGDPTKKFKKSMLPHSVSEYLLKASTDLDTTSLLRALFDNFSHWCEKGLKILPLPLLTATVKSMAILSDLFDDISNFKSTYGNMKALFVSKVLDDHPSKAFIIYSLLKCAAVVDLEELDPSVSLSDLCKHIEGYIQNGLQSEYTEVRYCTLQGCLYILQSFAIEELAPALLFVNDFVKTELYKAQKMTDILTECSTETTDYHVLLWAVAFRLMTEALPIDSGYKSEFVKMVCDLFVDPRLPTWQKDLLTSGIESLIIHSSNYIHHFRPVALECFDTYQLQPLHLRYALSIYITCVYRELHDATNVTSLENFKNEIQKILNMFSFYNTYENILQITPVIADLLYSVCGKEFILYTLISLVAPHRSSDNWKLEMFDKAILYLIYEVFRRIIQEGASVFVNLCLKTVFPKIRTVENFDALQLILMVVLCAPSSDPTIHNRIHLILFTDPLPSTSVLNKYAALFMDSFIKMAKAANPETNMNQDTLLKLLSQQVQEGRVVQTDLQRVSLFIPPKNTSL